MEIPSRLQVITLEDQVLFPHSIVHVTTKDPQVADSWLQEDNLGRPPTFFAVVPVSDASQTEHLQGRVCTVARVLKRSFSRYRQTLSVTLQGVSRAKVNEVMKGGTDANMMVRVGILNDKPGALSAGDSASEKAFYAELDRFFKLTSTNPRIRIAGGPEALREQPVGRLADTIVASIDCSYEEKLAVLNAISIPDRLKSVVPLLACALDEAAVSGDIKKAVKDDITKMQRDFHLRRQLKAIQKELGEDDEGGKGEVAALEEKIEAAGMPNEVLKVAKKELAKLKRMPAQQAEYGMLLTYVETLADMPWKLDPTPERSIPDATKLLQSEHYGMEDANRRLLEYLAVRQLCDGKTKGPILCFVGPPGVGKTSLGQSIAKVLSRPLVRVALGGVHDEADIRGHRRTYIGAMPGRVIQAIKRCGVRNPVVLLDEVDKTGTSHHNGDVTSALLELLDPAQNHNFTDHYLDVPFDLSECVFVATANNADAIPGPLMDRMEVLNISGYTTAEKVEIAKIHLMPKLLPLHGLPNEDSILASDDSLVHLVRRYTAEAGVRDLERKLAAVCRHAALRLKNNEGGAGATALGALEITPPLLKEVLGTPRHDESIGGRLSVPGVAVGLVWTAVGGQILFVEANATEGTGKLTLTGQLGDVIRESAQIAMSYVRQAFQPPLPQMSHHLAASQLEDMTGYPSTLKDPTLHARPHAGLGTTAMRASRARVEKPIQTELADDTDKGGRRKRSMSGFDGMDVHVHFPAGAVPKDGPSAGVTLVTVLTSLLTQRCVRSDTAMTGEVTLRGHVLPVGGIKEKVLAAHTKGIKRIILPQANRADVEKVPENVRNAITFIFAENVEDVLANAFHSTIHAKL